MKAIPRQNKNHGFTALEALIVLLLLAVLAVTALAVYQKQSAAASVEESPNRHDDAEPGKLKPESPVKIPEASANN